MDEQAGWLAGYLASLGAGPQWVVAVAMEKSAWQLRALLRHRAQLPGNPRQPWQLRALLRHRARLAGR